MFAFYLLATVILAWISGYNFANRNKETEKIFIENFIEARVVTDDEWNNVSNGNVRLSYLTKNDGREIGYIDYRNSTGQIGLFRLDEEYRNRGLGKQILSKVIEDLRQSNVSEVWAVTIEHHPFWSNVYNKSFTFRERPHLSVTGSGYHMKL